MKRALVVVDMQLDFMAGGALPVPRADEVVPIVNRLIREALADGWHLFFTADWHPPDHASFRSEGGPWPSHCVAGTEGAGWARGLDVPATGIVIHKGTAAKDEGYSAFDSPDFARLLKTGEVTELVVVGVATEYCVKSTVLDSLWRGYAVTLVVDATCGISVRDASAALDTMRAEGVHLARSHQFFEGC